MSARTLAGLVATLLALAAPLRPEAPRGAGGMGGTAREARPGEAAPADMAPVEVDFRDVAVEAGLTAPNVSGGAVKRYMVEATGNGVGLLDYDGDGRLDVLLPRGSALRDPPPGVFAATLYRNLGGLRFEDVTEKAGLARGGWAQGVCAGDYDGDGHIDLFLTHYGHSVLYRNDARGRFEDVSEAAGVRAAAPRWDTGCTFVDYDLDGDLDLAVAGYMDFDLETIPVPGAGDHCAWRGIPVACGPRGVKHTPPRLLRNEGGGRFRDVSAESGFAAAAGCYGFTVIAGDFDDDTRPDLYVACDSTPSLLFHNQGDGTFEEVGVLSGAALNEDGHAQGGMGAAAADLDGDGRLDVVKTNFSDDVPNFYRNRGGMTFEDHVYESGLGGRNKLVGWGVNVVDVDHDGRPDLLLVNGHVYPEAEQVPEYGFRQRRLLYRNVGGGRFVELPAGDGIATEAWSSRGSAAGDLDGDGALEVVVNNIGDRPSLLKNFGRRGSWLLVRARTASGRDALGARVRVHVGGRTLRGEVQGGGSFLSQGGFRVHFGLSDAARYDGIEVTWPGGKAERFPGGRANAEVTVTEGTGVAPAPAAVRLDRARTAD